MTPPGAATSIAQLIYGVQCTGSTARHPLSRIALLPARISIYHAFFPDLPCAMARFVITVDFFLHAGTLEPFLKLIKDNARTSMADEPGCDRFDVLIEKGAPDHILLYEIYTDRAAFDFHLKSRHFAEFNAASQRYVKEKKLVEFEYTNDTETGLN
jgi:autoinducer 2-degrading protein